MIDIIVNEDGGLVVAHDERELDLCHRLAVAADGAATLSDDSGFSRMIGLLKAPLLSRLRPGQKSWNMRTTAEWTLAAMRPLTVNLALVEV